MDVTITMTEAQFDAYRKFRDDKPLDPIALHRTVVERLSELLTDRQRVQGVFGVREASHDLRSACKDIKHTVDLAFSEHKIKV